MIFFFIFAFALLLSLRYLFLFFLKKSRVASLVGFLLYLLFALTLTDPALDNFSEGLKIKIASVFLFAAFAGYPLYQHLRQPQLKRSLLTWKSSLFHICILMIWATLVGINALENLSIERNILKICVTGKVETRETQWKNPNGPLQQSKIEYHEVILKKPDNIEIARYFLPGDLIGVRAKTFRFPALLNALGISTKYHLDLIYSGYRKANEYNRLPIQAYPLHSPSSSFFNSLLFKYWESFFLRKIDSYWVKSATLESNYFPMTDENGKPVQGEFHLSISSFGIS